jgi:hypothetical protein
MYLAGSRSAGDSVDPMCGDRGFFALGVRQSPCFSTKTLFFHEVSLSEVPTADPSRLFNLCFALARIPCLTVMYITQIVFHLTSCPAHHYLDDGMIRSAHLHTFLPPIIGCPSTKNQSINALVVIAMDLNWEMENCMVRD